MTTLSEAVTQEIAALQQKRDELRVQMHLANQELKERWDKLETRWLELEDKAKDISQVSEQSLHVVKATTQKLVDEIRDGYQNIKKAL